MAQLASLLALSLLALALASAVPVPAVCEAELEDSLAFIQQEAFLKHGAQAALQQETVRATLEQGTAAELLHGLTSVGGLGVSFGAVLAEFVAMTLFVVIGCGCAMGIAKEPGAAWILQVSLTFGFAITSLAYSVGAYSGGQINCAVTLGLVLVGNISVAQGILNFVAQMLGSIFGALILCTIFPKDEDKTGGLGSNGIAEGYSKMNAFVGEVMMTFLLMFVVLETAVNTNSEANRAVACIAIGFAVFLAHTVLIPIDGCSINPTRSFGPALVAAQRYGKVDTFKDMSVFFAGPLLGAALAAGAYGILLAC